MVDYSAWSGVEVSSDEEELGRTPSLEPRSLSRFRHQRHLEEAVDRRRTGRTDAGPRRLHAADLSRPGFTATRLSPAQPSPPAPSLESLLPRLGPIVRRWLRLTELEESRDFLLELANRDLCSSEGVDLVNVACVARAEAESGTLETAARQAALLRLVLAAAEERATSAKDAGHIRAFFAADGLERVVGSETGPLVAAFRRRAAERRAAGAAPLAGALSSSAQTAEAVGRAQAAVLATLPADFAAAMRAQDRRALEAAAERLSEDALGHALRRCADVRLWRLPDHDSH